MSLTRKPTNTIVELLLRLKQIAKLVLDFNTATGAANAVTLNGQAGEFTTEALTTAALTDITYTLTNNRVKSGDLVLPVLGNGTNSQGSPVLLTTNVTNGTVTFKIRNAHATQALNGTLKVGFLVLTKGT